jgi:hypothetical protein
MSLQAVAAAWLLLIPTTIATLMTSYWLVSIQVAAVAGHAGDSGLSARPSLETLAINCCLLRDQALVPGHMTMGCFIRVGRCSLSNYKLAQYAQSHSRPCAGRVHVWRRENFGCRPATQAQFALPNLYSEMCEGALPSFPQLAKNFHDKSRVKGVKLRNCRTNSTMPGRRATPSSCS